MIIVKFESGALGNFMASIVHPEIKPVATLDYGKLLWHKILHTGAYANLDDAGWIKDYGRNDRPVISHNNPKFENFISNMSNTKNIFIKLDSNFIEYRLNYIYKMPTWNLKMNNHAINDSWKNFSNPVACDDAKRIVRLYHGDEQLIQYDKEKDHDFSFSNFYISNRNNWIDALAKLAKSIDVAVSDLELSDWYDCFQQGQSVIIKKAKIINDCVYKKKFLPGLTENEKGLIIGSLSLQDKDHSNEYFIESYKSLSC